MVLLTVFGFASFLALVNERLVERLFAPMVEGYKHKSMFLAWISLIMGVFISIGFGLDLFVPLLKELGLEPLRYTGIVMTGFFIGGESNLMHKLWPS